MSEQAEQAADGSVIHAGRLGEVAARADVTAAGRDVTTAGRDVAAAAPVPARPPLIAI